MSRAARWVINNLPLMIMALILAALSWVVAIEEADPTVERRFPQPIPIRPTGLDPDLNIVGEFDEQVRASVLTTQSVWATLAVEDFQATVDLSGLEPGMYEVPIALELAREPSRITEVDPEVVVVELEYAEDRDVPVRFEIEGRPAVGYVSRTEMVEPRQVKVSGPSSYVARVADAWAFLSIQDAMESREERLSLQPRDEEGNIVPHVALRPEAVDVRVAIEPTGYHASLAVKAVLTGEVASGYRITDIAVDPPTVTVFGHPDILAGLDQGFVETRPIAVEGATGDITVRPGLTPPSQVTVIPGFQLEVHVFIEAIQSSVTITATPEIQGMEPGYTVTVSPETVEVILSGPLPTLQTLMPDDVRVVVSVFELPIGTHRLEPEVIAPPDITPQGIIPATVQVRIAEVVYPTPIPDTVISTPPKRAAIKTGNR